ADHVGCGLWIYFLAQLFANHAYWRGVAAGQAFDEFNAVLSIGADRDRLVHLSTTTPALDSQRRAQVFHQVKSTPPRATECSADRDMGFAGRLLAKHRIKRYQLEDIDRLQPQPFRDPYGGFVADDPEMFLPQMQERHRRASMVLTRITRDRVVHLPLQFGRNLDARPSCHGGTYPSSVIRGKLRLL